MEDIEGGQWLTLAELAAARHTSEASATRLVRRHTQWRRQKDNQGHVRVLVPPDALTADICEDVLEDIRQQDSEAVLAAVAGLIARAEQAEAAADRHRERADAAEAQAAHIEQDRERANALIASLEADLRAKNVEIIQAAAEASEQRTAAEQARAEARETQERTEKDRRAAEGRAEKAEAAVEGERSRADALRERLDIAERDLAVVRHDAEAVQQAAIELRRAEEARNARGRLRRAWDGWRRR
jgi:hypothetical protein